MPQRRNEQLALPLFDIPPVAEADAAGRMPSDSRAIEAAEFPFEHISEIAELESWRKEVNRPIYHVHKWWAQRLGSVFRAMVLATCAPAGTDILDLFYSPARIGNVTVFDPFMGSGTTIGEVLKVGGRAIGRDINSVAYFLVTTAMSLGECKDVDKTFSAIKTDVSEDIHRFYRARLANRVEAPVLYYFWVKQVACPHCGHMVDLFDSYIFVRHAYSKSHPEAQALCPSCGGINKVNYDSRSVVCASCNGQFDPASGPARGAKATCPRCEHTFSIAQAVRRFGGPPAHRQYAKLVLAPDGRKIYLATDDFDRQLYENAARELARKGGAPYVGRIEPGYNTNQVLNYCYSEWNQLFNARQLLCLHLLADRVKAIPDPAQRALFCCLFSGVLEFNNMFASFKGEGTGAVRHMFSHHILKPERTPLEANPWGTVKSSGSFSTLFETRILRALDYAKKPFEIRPIQRNKQRSTEKIFGLSKPLVGYVPANSFEEFSVGKTLYLSCGDSAHTDVQQGSVDAVITDPPFFDNVHYSQLADFFYGWQRYIMGTEGVYAPDSTRCQPEVQQTDAAIFTERLTGVWRECHRVLKNEGLLVFTYHHSRAEGWRSILSSIRASRFWVVAAHPVKSEMSVGTPKSQAREPIDIDIILVCRKVCNEDRNNVLSLESLVGQATEQAKTQVLRLRAVGRSLSRNDIQAIFMAQAIVLLSLGHEDSLVFKLFREIESRSPDIVEQLHSAFATG